MRVISGSLPPACFLTLDRQGVTMQRQFQLFCPACGGRIPYQPGLCGDRHLQAIRLQAERLGVEVTCPACDVTFIYSRLGSLTRFKRESEYSIPVNGKRAQG